MAMSVVYSNAFGGVIAENRGGVVSEYVPDTLGSTIGLLNSTGTTLTDRWEYWPYGEVLSRTGTSVTPFTFLGVIGYFKDVLDKLFYVRARHLRVDLARWLTTDPVWPFQSGYGYVDNRPSQVSDRSGLGGDPPGPQPNPQNACIYAACSGKLAIERFLDCKKLPSSVPSNWLGLINSLLGYYNSRPTSDPVQDCVDDALSGKKPYGALIAQLCSLFAGQSGYVCACAYGGESDAALAQCNRCCAHMSGWKGNCYSACVDAHSDLAGFRDMRCIKRPDTCSTDS